jgi:hypothetical protein
MAEIPQVIGPILGFFASLFFKENLLKERFYPE